MLYLYFMAKANAERGAGMAEYSLLLALVAVALVAGFGDLATGIDGVIDTVIAAF